MELVCADYKAQNCIAWHEVLIVNLVKHSVLGRGTEWNKM